MVEFPKFYCRLRDMGYGTIAAALYAATREAEHMRAMPVRELIALYISGLQLSDMPIRLEFRQFPQWSTIDVQGIHNPKPITWKVNDTADAELVSRMMAWNSVDEYTLRYSKPNSLRVRINRFKPLISKYFLFPEGTEWGLKTLRRMRVYALLNDHQYTPNAIRSALGIRSWWFNSTPPALPIELARQELMKHTGVKIT